MLQSVVTKILVGPDPGLLRTQTRSPRVWLWDSINAHSCAHEPRPVTVKSVEDLRGRLAIIIGRRV